MYILPQWKNNINFKIKKIPKVGDIWDGPLKYSYNYTKIKYSQINCHWK